MGTINNGIVSYSVQVQAQHTTAFSKQKKLGKKIASNIATTEVINGAQIKSVLDTSLYGLVKNYPIVNNTNIVNQSIPGKTTLDLDPIEYSKIFKTEVDIVNGDSDQIGTISYECKRGLLTQACEKIIQLNREKIEREEFPWGIDKPTNDKDLYEWIRDFPEYEDFKELTTKTEGFSTAFGLINRNGDDVIPITSEETKMNWVRKNVMPTLSEKGINRLYIFTPEGVGATNVVEQGVNITFIPTTAIDKIQRRVTDNSGFYGAMKPRVGNGNGLTDGILRFENNTDAEKIVGEILEQIGLFMQPSSLNLLYQSIGQKEKINYRFSNYKYMAN